MNHDIVQCSNIIEYIIKVRESILLYYSTMYQLFTGVSDLCSAVT